MNTAKRGFFLFWEGSDAHYPVVGTRPLIVLFFMFLSFFFFLFFRFFFRLLSSSGGQAPGKWVSFSFFLLSGFGARYARRIDTASTVIEAARGEPRIL